MPEIKVHPYQVIAHANTGNITEVLMEAQATPLADRLRIIGQQEIRLEHVVAPNGRGNPTPYWLCDFARLRFEHGPGKVSRQSAVEGFDLRADEGFGEETAALYDDATGYMLIQYNHFGVRSGTIQAYLSNFSNVAARTYDFRVKMDESSELRLAQKQVLKKIHFKVASAQMTERQRHAGVSLSRAIELSDELDGQTIEVVISAGRGELQAGRLRRVIDSLRTLSFQNALSPAPVVEKFEVVGKETPDSRAEAIDMLTPKVESTIDGVVLGPDRRFTRQSRYEALVRARNGWAALLRA